MTFTDWTLAAGIEAELIRFEAESGRSVAYARRPVSDDEARAAVMFGDIDAVVTANTAEGSTFIDALYAAAMAAVLVELFGEDEGTAEDVVEVAVAAAALMWILAERPQAYRAVAQSVEPDIRRLISASHTGGALTVIDEATRQGLDTSGWRVPWSPGIAGTLAADVVGHPLRRTVDRLLQDLQTPARAVPGTITRGELAAFIRDTSRAGTVDLLHQSNQAALALGRIEMAASVPNEPTLIVASELLDTNTCAPCKSADGRQYETIAEAAADYPAGYARCLGGSRCRGVLVFLWV